VENGAALGDRRRIDRHADVLFDPLGGTPGGLIGAGLVLTDSHGLSTAVVAERYVAGEPGHGADEGALTSSSLSARASNNAEAPCPE
jgi:hypothetical protein